MSDADRTITSSSPFGSDDPYDGDVSIPGDHEDVPDPAQDAAPVTLFPSVEDPFRAPTEDSPRSDDDERGEDTWTPPYTQPDALWGDDAMVAPAPATRLPEPPYGVIADVETQEPAAEPRTDETLSTGPQEWPPVDPPGEPVEMPTDPPKRILSFWHWLLELGVVVAIGFVLALGIKQWIVQPFEIPSTSMMPTLEIGDRVLVDKMSYVWGRPVPGDIVVLTSPDRPSEDLIKRVVAVAGQEIDVREGVVYVDGVRNDEPYVERGVVDTYSMDGTQTVPPASVFLMGDNRTNSRDSRVFGPQPIAHLLGRAFVIYWPFGRFGGL